MILDDIIVKRKIQLEREKAAVSPEKMKELALSSERKTISFKDALLKNGMSIISEVKKSSPSKSGIYLTKSSPCSIRSRRSIMSYRRILF